MVRGTILAAGLLAVIGLAAGAAVADDKPVLSDAAIEKLSTALVQIGERQRTTIYFDSEPPAEVKAYLEGQGINVVVAARPGTPAGAGTAPATGAPATVVGALPPAAGSPYGAYAIRTPERGEVIRQFLQGVRDLASAVPPDSGVELDGFTVDFPAGSVHFRVR